jgi:predicted nucleic acid-binding protein
LDAQVLEEACQLVQKYPIRAYDSVQLASAIVLLSYFQQARSANFTFVTADARLMEIARMTGLEVINPNNAA